MKFNLLAIIFASCFLFSCTQGPDSNAVESDAPSSDSIAVSTVERDKPIESVEDIQEAFTGIMKQWEGGALDSVSFEYSCHNGGRSGTVSYYSQDGDLRLIVHRYSEYSHYSAEDQYFVRDSTLFFSFLKGISWSFEDGPEGSVRDNITERRTYLLGNQPVKCLEKKYVIRSQIKDKPRPESLPNMEVDCTSSPSLLKSYAQLLQHHRNPPASGCLELD